MSSAGASKAKTLIIIPAYNEEESLPGVLKELSVVVADVDVVVVDDGSSDGTAEVARQSGARVLRLPFNLGVGAALRTGFRFAVDRSYDRAVQFDADGQHDPEEIPALLAALDAGADLAVGSRFASEERSYEVGGVRRGAMGLLRQGVRLLVGRRFSDTSSGFRAFSRPLLEFFARTYPDEYLGDTVEALLLGSYHGFRIVERPVRMRSRQGGEASSRGLRLIYHYLRVLLVMVATASRRMRRATR